VQQSSTNTKTKQAAENDRLPVFLKVLARLIAAQTGSVGEFETGRWKKQNWQFC
jgi:hypothetical protein